MLHLVVADGDDDLTDAERARLHAALKRAHASAEHGDTVDGNELLAELRARDPRVEPDRPAR